MGTHPQNQWQAHTSEDTTFRSLCGNTAGGPGPGSAMICTQSTDKQSVEVTGGCPATLPLPLLPTGSLPPSRTATTGMLPAAPHVWVSLPTERLRQPLGTWAWPEWRRRNWPNKMKRGLQNCCGLNCVPPKAPCQNPPWGRTWVLGHRLYGSIKVQ